MTAPHCFVLSQRMSVPCWKTGLIKPIESIQRRFIAILPCCKQNIQGQKNRLEGTKHWCEWGTQNRSKIVYKNICLILSGSAADPFLRLERFLNRDRCEGVVIDEVVRRHSIGKDWIGTIIVNPDSSKLGLSISNIDLFLIIYAKCTIRFFNTPDTTFRR